MKALDAHLVVVGSGVAGLYAALQAAEAGVQVTLLTKGSLTDSNTHVAQGGICAVLSPEEAAPGDSVEAHIADTLAAGAGQCDPAAVRILCEEAGSDIAALERYGVVFDRDSTTGRRALGLEGAHSAARILHAGGDATGAAIADGLIRAVHEAAERGTITIVQEASVQKLLRPHGSVSGLRYQRGGQTATLAELEADGVLLATGGAGQLYDTTTNPAVATADGVALAWRAGAMLSDLEFFQFHPTALAVGEGFLISEAVRGAGAVLRDADGEAFMTGYHPDGDLAPRDVVSRSISAHQAARQSAGKGGQTVFLDATGVEATHGMGYLARRFPTIDAATRALGLDWTQEWLPVTPSAHYWMGGVTTNLDGQTSLNGLYAAGEVACTGVHGANRLASNSLLEGLVFGRRAVAAFMEQALTAEKYTGAPNTQKPWWVPATARGTLRRIARRVPSSHGWLTGPDQAVVDELRAAGCSEPPKFGRASLGHLLGAQAGVVRDESGLRHAEMLFRLWRSQQPPSIDRAGVELENLLTVAELLVGAALVRCESAGAHFRSDCPNPATEGRAPNFWVAATDLGVHGSAYLPILESETA